MAKENKERARLVKLCKELAIPDDVAAELVDVAIQQEKPEDYLRNFAAEVEAQAASDTALPSAETPAMLTLEQGGNCCSLTAIGDIPLADKIAGRDVTGDWPPRISKVQVFIGHQEAYQKDALTRLYHGLQASGARLKPRTPDEPPRVIDSHADAIKWLLEQI